MAGERSAAASGMDASAIIQNFIKSIGGPQSGKSGAQEQLFTTLADLLLPVSTLPLIDAADTKTVDGLLQYLPPTLIALAQEADDNATVTIENMSVEASEQALSLDQKKDILRRVLRSPQFSQSLSSLTFALRDGGLPMISEALNIPVRNGGYMKRGGGATLGGGDAVEAFLEGVKDIVEKKDASGEIEMDTN